MNVLVVSYHPLSGSFTAATTARVLDTLSSSGRHTLRHQDLHAETPACENAPAGAAAMRESATTDLQWCDALVLVYPTWWSGQPAALTQWLQSAIADLTVNGSAPRPLRNVRRIAAVTSHGSSKLVNIAQGEGGKRVLSRGVRRHCHPLTRMSWTAFYGIDRSTRDERQRFLEKIERRLERW